MRLLFSLLLLSSLTWAVLAAAKNSSRTKLIDTTSAGTKLKKITSLLTDSLKKLNTGDGTYYHTGLGSCGFTNADTDMVVAVNKDQMKNGANPNKNSKCHKKVHIRGSRGECNATVVDTCPTCYQGDLDMSEVVFKKVCGNLAIGRCKIRWQFT